MIAVGEPYRPAGPISVRSVLTTIILGTVVAILGAIGVWLWEISPIPTLVLLTAMIHGLLIGAAMAFMVGRLRMRNPWLIGTIGLACGFLSAGLVHLGHYYRMVSDVNAEVRKQVAEDQSATPEQKKAYLDGMDQNPTRETDAYLMDKTGHGGFLGSMLLRNEIGVTIKGKTPVTGIFLWLLWGGEAVFVACMAMSLPVARASQPFCEDCGYWCDETASPLAFPPGAGEDVMTAIREDSPAEILEAYTKTPSLECELPLLPKPKSFRLSNATPVSPGALPVNLTLHRCPNCELAFASVSIMVPNGDKLKKVVMLKEIRVSDQTAQAMEHVPEAVALEAEEIVPDGEIEV